MIPPPKKGTGYSNQESPSAKICNGTNEAASPFGLAARFARGLRAPRLFMMAIVALYSRTRRASSSRRSFSSFSRSAPRAAGDAGGIALLRTARIACLGCFARANDLASSSVTGPLIEVVALVRALGRALAVAAFLPFAEVICFPHKRLVTAGLQSVRRAVCSQR